jgi:hypothetical protein
MNKEEIQSLKSKVDDLINADKSLSNYIEEIGLKIVYEPKVLVPVMAHKTQFDKISEATKRIEKLASRLEYYARYYEEFKGVKYEDIELWMSAKKIEEKNDALK